MSLEQFVDSKPFTFGIELEMQVVNTHDYDLTKAASDLMRLVKDQEIPGNITPEITESMIELSTGICTTHEQAVTDLRRIRDTLVTAADRLRYKLPYSIVETPNDVLGQFPLAEQPDAVETYYVNAADAQAEADRRAALRSKVRKIYRISGFMGAFGAEVVSGFGSINWRLGGCGAATPPNST